MKTIAIGLLGLLVLSLSAIAQTDRSTRPRVIPTPEAQAPTLKNDVPAPSSDRRPPVLGGSSLPRTQPNAQTPSTTGEVKDDDVIRVETNLVTMPVSVLDRDGRFVSGLQQKDFKVFENGVEQKIEYFQSVEQPFTVVLMIDVSPSTQYRIDEIQDAAISFVNQLRPNDKVMVIAFDDQVRVLCRPTNDRVQLRWAIREAQFGDGTSLYEAVDHVLNRELKNIQGRKAVVLFTDGVDTTSRRASYESTLADVEESDSLFYTIRYNTLRDGMVIGGRGGYPGQTGGDLGDIIGIILGGGGGGRFPFPRGGRRGGGGSQADYEMGRQYLLTLADSSGGREFEADTVYNLDAAFGGIAEELRRQYSIGYYPDNVGQVGDRKQIKVRVARPNLSVKARTTYVVGQDRTRTTGK
jgi:Ca-activated chloride channel homolog